MEEMAEARYWRKNRGEPHPADLNRNFGSAGAGVWGRDTSSKSITLLKSDIYQGECSMPHHTTSSTRARAAQFPARAVSTNCSHQPQKRPPTLATRRRVG